MKLPTFSIADGGRIHVVPELPLIAGGWIIFGFQRRAVVDVHHTANGTQIELMDNKPGYWPRNPRCPVFP